MNAMLTDEDLTRLLGEAADGFVVPELELPERARPARWHRRRWQGGAAAAALVVGTVLVQSAMTGPGGGTPAADKAATMPTALAQRSADGAFTGAVAGAAPSESGTLGTPGSATVGGQASVPQDAARIVKTGTLTLVVDHGKVSTTVGRLQALVTGSGGYVSDSTSQEAGDHPSATVTVRVPVARFEALVAEVRALKATVVSAQTSGKDVTADYADTQAQIQSLQAARSRYLAILAGARTIAETLTVQQRVDDVQGQIDRLEGQRRLLADQSDLGTLTVTVGEHADQALVTAPPSGWTKAWRDARHGFASGLQSLLAGSGRALLVLLVGAALLLLGRVGWRHARRRLL